MTSADAMRASDTDREKVVQALQEQVGEGRLTLAEFEQRSTEAYATAKTVGDLRALTDDLPIDPLAPPKPPVASWQQPWPFDAQPMRPVPPWHQQPVYGTNRTGGPIVRRVHPVRIAIAALLVLWAVGAVVSVIAHVPFILPGMFILFFLFARGGGGRRRRNYR